MLYGKDYSGPVTCAEGHECEYVEMCAKCDGEAYCEKHLTQCDGCKKQLCAKHAEALSKTDCGMLCEDCEEVYAPWQKDRPHFGPIDISDEVRRALLGENA